MNIKYRHKETGYILDLKTLKENKDKTFFFFDSEEWEYAAKEIPLSDDFEIICVDKEFIKEE